MPGNINERMANERTLLAWIRTSIAVITFGFVIVKFSLFIRQLSIVLGKDHSIPQYGYSGPIGILLVLMGAAGLVFGTLRYRATEKQISDGSYEPRATWLYIFSGFMFVISLLLAYYLLITTKWP